MKFKKWILAEDSFDNIGRILVVKSEMKKKRHQTIPPSVYINKFEPAEHPDKTRRSPE